jgi:hypothetical protein
VLHLSKQTIKQRLSKQTNKLIMVAFKKINKSFGKNMLHLMIRTAASWRADDIHHSDPRG